MTKRGRARGGVWRGAQVAGLLVCAGGISGCSDSLPTLPKIGDINPFKEKQTPLPGRRIPVLPSREEETSALPEATGSAVILPAQHANDVWPQPGGTPNNAPGHLALGTGLRQIWSADAGTGSSKKGRVTASPIVYGGRIYTLDADGHVSAFSSEGNQLWHVSLVPEGEAKSSFSLTSLNPFGSSGGGGFGGGLAADGGHVIAASGYGTVAALDPQSGQKVWEKNLGSPIRSSPTAVNGQIFVSTIEGRTYCLSAADGAEVWAVRGLPQQASLVLNTSPAVDGGTVIVPYPTGDVAALKISDGSALWTDSLSRARTTSQLTALSNAARPAVDGGTVFAVGHGGRMIAVRSKTGERLWSLNLAGTQMPWVAGKTVFTVDTSGQIFALARDDGKVLWRTKLPNQSWAGPVLAGGHLWLASGKGELVGVDAVSGKIAVQLQTGSPVYIAPVVAQGRLYVLTDNAKLVAFAS